MRKAIGKCKINASFKSFTGDTTFKKCCYENFFAMKAKRLKLVLVSYFLSFFLHFFLSFLFLYFFIPSFFVLSFFLSCFFFFRSVQWLQSQYQQHKNLPFHKISKLCQRTGGRHSDKKGPRRPQFS